MPRRLAFLVAAPLLLAPALATAHPVTADGNPSEWTTRLPTVANLGLVARDASGHGTFVWRDATADARTDISTPEVVSDIAAFQVTGSPTGLAFLLRRPSGATFTGQPIQVQIAVDTDRVAGSGMDYLGGYADTKVGNAARWERLITTLFGSGGKAQVLDTSFTKVADAEAAQGVGGEVEIVVPWSALGLSGPPATPLRFTVATFRAQANDLTVDVGGPNVSNALDCVSDYGDPAAAAYPNTWVEVMDQVVDHHFDLWFDAQGEVVAPLVLERFVSNASGAGADEWYAIRNTTGAAIPLDQHKIGDEETPDGNEGMFLFPVGASIPAGGSYIVARSGAAYQAFFGKAPDAELPPGATAAVPDLAPFPAWTSAASPDLQLGNAGDELLLLDPSNTLLDVVVYGNGAYAGVPGFTVAPGLDEVLTRYAQAGDTDDCEVDFTNAGQACTADAQCGDVCLGCTGNLCGFRSLGAPCPDANPCDGDEVCDGQGACVTSPAPPCDDQNPCTVDACSPASGCTHAPVAAGTSCSDGDVCNGVEVCDAVGACLPGTPLVCADQDPCTIDSCDPVIGCGHAVAADGTSCADGDACNGAEACQAGVCAAGAPLSCDDGNPCTVDACDPAGGCGHVDAADGTSCGAGDACYAAAACQAGVCLAGAAVECDDGNPCTVDSCDPATGCTHVTLADGTACGGPSCSGTCSAGTCACGTGGAGGGGGSGGSQGGSGGGTTTGSGEPGGGGTTTTGSGTGGGVQDGACGCRVAGAEDDVASRATGLLGLLAAAFLRRRRR